MRVYATRASGGQRGGYVFFIVGGTRPAIALRSLLQQTQSLGHVATQDFAAEFANAVRRPEGVAVAVTVDGEAAVLDPREVDRGALMEMPYGIFMGGRDPETIRHQLFADDESVTPPPRFQSGNDWNEWVDEASRRSGGIRQLTERIQADDILRRSVINSIGGIDDENVRQAAGDSALLRNVGEDQSQGVEGDSAPGEGTPGEGSGQTARAPARRGDAAASGGRDVSPGDGGGDPLRGDRDVGGGHGLGDDYRITGPLGTLRGEKTRAGANIRAIETLLEVGDSPATPEQQELLAQYVGWGGLPNIFDESKEGWKQLRDQLKSLTSEDEYAAMRASTLNAHYTAVPVIQAMWGAVESAGYDGRGDVLEPAAGIGHFIGAGPEDQNVTAVELDPFTASIAAKLYPNANVVNEGFEKTDIGVVPEFDLAVGNPPFGNERLYDGNHRDLRSHSVHNYFLAKSIRAVRPGGMAAFVLSRYFLDSGESKTRKLIHQHADLVGAVRLPETAFESNAGTNVVTDIVVFRKRGVDEPVPDLSTAEWIHADRVRDEATGEFHHLNRMIAGDPSRIIGEPHYDGKMFRGSCYSVRCDDFAADDQIGLGAELKRRLQFQIAEHVNERGGPLYAPKRDPQFDRAPASEVPSLAELDPNARQRKMGGLIVHTDGEIYAIKANPETLRMDLVEKVNPKSATGDSRLRSLLEIRDSVRELLDHEANPQPDVVAMTQNRDDLRGMVEAFLERFAGPYNGAVNTRLLADEPDVHLILSLHDSETGVASPILSRRVNNRPREISKPETLPDAVSLSFSERGRLDIDFIAEALDSPVEDVIAGLLSERMAFRDPQSGEVVARDEYLSGNVRDKLDAAKTMVDAGDEQWQSNVTALTEVMPPDVPAEDIFAQLQSPWLPAEIYVDFMREWAGIPVSSVRFGIAQNVKLVLDRQHYEYRYGTGQYGGGKRAIHTRMRADFGTDRMDAVSLLANLANGRPIEIYDTVEGPDGKDRRVLNPEETAQARIKADAMKGAFRDWIWKDHNRADHLAKIYNQTMNSHVPRSFDGSAMRFEGMANEEVSLRRNQRDAAWRMVCQDRTLIDHAVGAGKTYSAIAGEMEKQRMGLSNKAMFVVPNHLVGQWAQEFQRLYPGSNVLTMEPGKFTKQHRRAFLAKIATGDWSAVICPHSTFSMINVDKAYQEEMIRKEIKDARLMIAEIEHLKRTDPDSAAVKSLSVKQIERDIKRLERNVRELQSKGQDDDLLTWGQLGFDSLIIDEAQEFKNLRYVAGNRNLAGLGPPPGSKKAFDLYTKIRWFDDQDERSSVTFLTGTPISNTVAECFHMMNYLDPNGLHERGCSSMGLWLRNFAEISDDYETTVTGLSFKQKTRVRAFHNLPELCNMYQSFADVVTNADLDEMHLKETGKSWPIPKIDGGTPTKVILEKSPMLSGIMDEICERMEAIEARRVTPDVDNVLKCLHDARTNALDVRIQNSGSKIEYDPNSKVEAVARNIVRIHEQSADVKGTQLVFCDLSTPKQFRKAEAEELEKLARLSEQGDARATELLAARPYNPADGGDFDVYNELRRRVVELSGGKITADEFAFVHEAGSSIANREKLFDRVRKGEVRVLMGSSQKMGTGMNVQDRLVALHHMDAPWRPADLEQREGRILRQGNMLYANDPENFTVEICRYGTQGTSDTKFWQTLAQKAQFIEQFRKGNAGAGQREMEDIGEVTTSYREMKALTAGNPLILDELECDQTVRRIEAEQRGHVAACRKYHSVVESLKDHERRAQRKISVYEKILEDYNSTPESGGEPGRIVEVPVEPNEGESKTDFEKRQSKARTEIYTAMTKALWDEARAYYPSPEGTTLKYRGLDVEFRAKGMPGTAAKSVKVTVSTEDGYTLRSHVHDPRDFTTTGFLQSLRYELRERLPRDIEATKANIPADEAAYQEALEKCSLPFPREAELERQRERLAEIRLSLAEQGMSAEQKRKRDLKRTQSRAA